MYARMTELQGFTGDIDAAVQTVRDTVVTRARDIDGFKGFLGFVDRDTKAFVSFTLWESEEAMRASEETANRDAQRGERDDPRRHADGEALRGGHRRDADCRNRLAIAQVPPGSPAGRRRGAAPPRA